MFNGKCALVTGSTSGIGLAVAGALAARGHPFAFYQRLGYEVVGLLPDVNGPGRPDILMAKRL